MPGFPDRLAQLRGAAGLTRLQLGTRLGGMDPSQIARWETGQTAPRLDSLVKLARTLKVSIDYLAGLTDDPTPAAQGQDDRAAREAWERGRDAVEEDLGGDAGEGGRRGTDGTTR